MGHRLPDAGIDSSGKAEIFPVQDEEPVGSLGLLPS